MQINQIQKTVDSAGVSLQKKIKTDFEFNKKIFLKSSVAYSVFGVVILIGVTLGAFSFNRYQIQKIQNLNTEIAELKETREKLNNYDCEIEEQDGKVFIHTYIRTKKFDELQNGGWTYENGKYRSVRIR